MFLLDVVLRIIIKKWGRISISNECPPVPRNTTLRSRGLPLPHRLKASPYHVGLKRASHLPHFCPLPHWHKGTSPYHTGTNLPLPHWHKGTSLTTLAQRDLPLPHWHKGTSLYHTGTKGPPLTTLAQMNKCLPISLKVLIYAKSLVVEGEPP